MLRACRLLLLLLLLPTAVFSQRYGRPYSLVNDPPVLLQVKAESKSRYFRAADLRKMQSSALTQSDLATKATHVYEGVTLEQLIPAFAFALASPGERLQIEFGSQQIRTVSAMDLDFQVKPMVVYLVDGKPISGHAPFYLVIKYRGKPVETIVGVDCISVEASR
jgi:hypothetical protein